MQTFTEHRRIPRTPPCHHTRTHTHTHTHSSLLTPPHSSSSLLTPPPRSSLLLTPDPSLLTPHSLLLLLHCSGRRYSLLLAPHSSSLLTLHPSLLTRDLYIYIYIYIYIRHRAPKGTKWSVSRVSSCASALDP